MMRHSLQLQVAETVKKYELLDGGGEVVVAVSGGPDSVALLNLLISMNNELQLPCTFTIAHLNHKLRGIESDEDEAFVRELAGRYGVNIEAKGVDVKSLSLSERHSIEEVARRERYTFFESVAKKVGAATVAIGHTADDNAETVLHRIIRGTGLYGLQGMRPKMQLPVNPPHPPFIKGGQGGIFIQLVRPLIFSWRKDILTYLEQEGLPYRIDSSNLQVDYFRNKIRLELLPLLSQQYNKNIKEALCRLSEIAQQNYDFLSARLDEVFKETLVEQQTHSCVLDASLLAKQPKVLRQLILRECMERLGVSLKHIGYKNYSAISEILEDSRGRKILNLSGGLTIRLEQGKLNIEFVETQDFASLLDRVEIDFPGTTALPSYGFHVTAETLENREGFLDNFKQKKTAFEEVFDFDKIVGTLYVRTRRDGDRFHPLGSKGSKKLKDFFIDEKVPCSKRNSIPILVMDDQPFWVVGMRIDERVKLDKDTKKVLKITFAFS